MSRQQPSEEKSLPASQKKLKDARKKGQVNSSQDFVTSLVVTAAVVFLWLRWPAMIRRWEALLDLPSQLAGMAPVPAGAAMLRAIGRLAGELVLPVVGLALVAAIVANIIVKRGVLFATDPVVPQLERIHPAKGMARIFSLKSLIDFLKSLVKAAALLTTLGITILYGLDALMQAPSCGIACLAGAFGATMRPLLIGALLLFLVAGPIDIGLQRWLFLREMRMTKTEAKRERKEMEGEPVFRRARRQRHRDSAMASTRLGIAHATLVVAAPGQVAVGLRFVRDETPAPVLVARAYDAGTADLLAGARAAGIVIVENPALARQIAKRTGSGAFIPKALFPEVAGLLVRHGLA